MTIQAPYPAETKAKGYRFELDLDQVTQSDTWALATPDIRPWLLMLWTTAWQQTPCGSMPKDDEVIAARLGMSVKAFEKAKPKLMRGWQEADDGRLYHATITKRVLEMLDRKSKEKTRKDAYRARMDAERKALALAATGQSHDSRFVPPLSHGTNTGHPQDKDGTDDTGTGTGTGTGLGLVIKEPKGSLSTALLPPCPHQSILNLYAKHLPENPQPRKELWDGSENAKALCSRWRWVLTAKKSTGARYAETAEAALAWFGRYFEYVSKCNFLTGKTEKPFYADLGFLMRKQKFSNVLQGNYENKEKT